MKKVRRLYQRPAARQRSGFVLWLLAVAVVASGLGGWWWFSRRDTRPDGYNIVLHEVQRGDFALDVTERGEIESAGVTEVISEVKTKNTPGVSIIRIIAEGAEVKKGDFLVELDNSAFKEERTAEQILVNTAAALVVQSRNIYETALIAKEEYLDGTYVQERQTLESAVFVAEENLNRAKEYYEYSKRLAAKGYVNQLQLEADKFAVEKTVKELEAAKTKLKVLDDYTKAKMLKQLESDIVIAKAKWESDKNTLELEEEKLAEIDLQIARCTITSPKDGTVTYAHNRENWGGEEFVVKEGAVIRERQAIIRLPDPSSMRAALNVNESLIQYIRSGMPATIAPVGAGGRKLRGAVEKINQYAEPSGWRKANIKEYKALVSIDEPAADLRSGMTASVTIHCESLPDAIQAPVQSVYSHGGKYFAFVYKDGAWEARPIRTGPTNDKFFVIEQGLAAGERIAMNPKGYLDQVTLPALPPAQKQQMAGGRSPTAPAEAVAKDAADAAKPVERSAKQPAAETTSAG